jgi:hypothetical protein
MAPAHTRPYILSVDRRYFFDCISPSVQMHHAETDLSLAAVLQLHVWIRKRSKFPPFFSKSDCHLTAQHLPSFLKGPQPIQQPIRTPSSLRFLQSITPYPAPAPPLFRSATKAIPKVLPSSVDFEKVDKNVLFKLQLWSCNLARETRRYGNYSSALMASADNE